MVIGDIATGGIKVARIGRALNRLDNTELSSGDYYTFRLLHIVANRVVRPRRRELYRVYGT